MSAEVHHGNRIAVANQSFGCRRVASAMLDKAVNEQYVGPRLNCGLPAALEQPQTVGGGKVVFNQGRLSARIG